MPIRFRCAYCNQLLGIARRKVGTVVRCPTCAGQVVVPDRDAEGLGDEASEQPLFERNDFDDLLSLPGNGDSPRPFRPSRRCAGASPDTGSTAWYLSRPQRFGRWPLSAGAMRHGQWRG